MKATLTNVTRCGLHFSSEKYLSVFWELCAVIAYDNATNVFACEPFHLVAHRSARVLPYTILPLNVNYSFPTNSFPY